jgi:hypothetical protein
MALGRYPDVTLADARERRDAARKRLANGVDPMAEKMAKKTAIKAATEHTFEKIAELWLDVLKNSALALDIYFWLTHRMKYLRKTTTVPWFGESGLYGQH